MNKRQKEKYNKRIWRQTLSKYVYDACGIYIKPSRLKLRIYQTGKEYRFVGVSGGYEFELTGVEKDVL